jgi:4-hydroxybenzoate polyprenyltransferase
VLFAAGLALAFGLDNWAGNTTDYEISKLTIFGIFIAYIYSAPPLKLKVMSLIASENASDKPAVVHYLISI